MAFWGSYEKIIKDLICVEFNKEQFLFEKFFSIVHIFRDSWENPILGETLGSLRGLGTLRFEYTFSTLISYYLILCSKIHFPKDVFSVRRFLFYPTVLEV